MRKLISLIIKIGIVLSIVFISILYIFGPSGGFNKKLYWFYVETTEVIRFERKAHITSLNLDEIDLLLSKNDIKALARPYKKHSDYFNSIEELYAYYSDYTENNNWRKAKMVYKNDTLPIKIKCHGKNPDNHKDGDQVSLSIKLLKSKTFRGVKRFNILIYWRIRSEYDLVSIFPEIHNKDASKEDQIIFKESKLINVRVNGGESHLYYMEYRINDEYMRIIDKPEKIVLRGGGEHSFIYAQNSIEEWNDSVHNYLKKSDYSDSMKKIIESFYDSINYDIYFGKYQSATEFLDIDYMANFHAIRLIAGFDGHGLGPKNLSVAFDTSNHKFYPIFHRDCPPKLLTKDRSPENTVNINSERNLNIHFGHYYSRNPLIRYASYKRLYEIIKNLNIDSISNKLESISNFHSALYFSSNIKSNFVRPKWSNIPKKNISHLKHYIENIPLDLNKSKNELKFTFQSNNFVHLNLDTFQELILSRNNSIKSSIDTIFKAEQLPQYLIHSDVDLNSNPIETEYKITPLNKDEKLNNINLINASTNVEIYQTDIVHKRDGH